MPTIYKLINPINREIYYVGYTERSAKARLEDHINGPGHETSKVLKKAKIKPIVEILETGEHVTIDTELLWIKKLYQEGHKLENSSGIITAEYLKRKTKASLANKLPEPQRLRIALQEILDELPFSATIPIVIRVRHIAETALLIPSSRS